MNEGKPSIRIDWFDGSLVEDARPATSQFADEDKPEPEKKLPQTERKPIGFKRLQDISLLKPPILILEVSNRPGFWNLFDEEELKGDFTVLIVRILANVIEDVQPGERSKIMKLLETRLLASNFLDKLIEYVNGLPNVKIVEKRMNAQLWDDVQDFYFQILYICEGLIRIFSGNNEALNKKLHLLLNDLCESAIGVSVEHSEQFNEELFERIQRLQAVVVTEHLQPTKTFTSNSTSDLESFKNINIFPTLHDLFPSYCEKTNDRSIYNKQTIYNENVTIQPNIINGAYPNVEHYLDIQFKLLREDYLGPLREGICKYLENPSKRRHENIRVYPQVRVIRTYVSNNRVGHLIDIAWKERITHTAVKKSHYHKRLMFGSLLLFTSDEFHTILCATVLDSSLELLKDGYLAVSFQNPVSKNIISEEFLMVESEVFFEPYHQVLKVLQDSRLDCLPMEKYIVDVKPETQPPLYLKPETIYTIEAQDNSEILFPVLDTDQWPKQLGLDDSQLDAFKFALTREFAVIQGPPGTGKTFLGVKIASTILKNMSLEGTPMLILCYTNHALDQFLEGVLNVTNSIVRLGSQSKSEKLEPYSLGAVRTKVKSKYSYLYAKKRAELEAIYKEMTELQEDIEKSEQGILCYKCIKPYLKINGKACELNNSIEDRVLNWLFEHLEETESQNNVIEEDSWENLEIDISETNIQTCFTEKSALRELDTLKSTIRHVDANKESFKNPEAVQKFHREIIKINKRLECFKSNMELYSYNKDHYKIENVDNLHILNTSQRWQMYFNAVKEIHNELMSQMDVLLEKHNTTNLELEEVSTLVDGEVLRTARVIGATTTAAARRHKLLENMQSPIVIVEEAAEVLEAHIIASLTKKCQHLILIGDHKQLRPTAANYKLSQHYNMDISLFERMVRNGIHARTLTIQRRMRPPYVQLLVPIIYDRLDSHPTVYGYPEVKGLGTSFYFFDHTELEDEGLDDSWSHQNPFEAKWCVDLANSLRNHYEPDDITILTTYTGQVSLIKKLSHKFESLKDVKITSVDNFQGEESRIVILSLVRSNREGKIGFLSAANRVCVALSRAKEGFYIFGNMSMLSAASPLWSSIYRKLKSLNAIGDRSTSSTASHLSTVNTTM